ncbi:DedA family protein [Candidatus Pelagibacter sp.]|nr:DedA family protein [Candidatus Pelagibacter sp.]
MFKELYKKSLKLASHKSSKNYLAIVAFAESSFFPIPPDIMIVPMVIAKKNDYIKIFLIASFFSALGGLFGYFLGSTFIDFSMKIFEIYGYEDKVLDLKNNLAIGRNSYIFLFTLFLAGFTPLPFKVFTITSGMIGFNIFLFFLICLMSRGLRFFVVSFLSAKFGKVFDTFLKNIETKWIIATLTLIIIILTTLYFIFIQNV